MCTIFILFLDILLVIIVYICIEGGMIPISKKTASRRFERIYVLSKLPPPYCLTIFISFMAENESQFKKKERGGNSSVSVNEVMSPEKKDLILWYRR